MSTQSFNTPPDAVSGRFVTDTDKNNDCEKNIQVSTT